MGRTKPLLNAQHILEKEFRVDTKGYRMTEVDFFLDAVYSDYKLYEDKIGRLVKELSDERSKNMSLEKELQRLQTRSDIANVSNDNTQSTNLDLLKRLSELEKMVYKSNE
ncbi:MAG: DivIVA domain-containing protein [Bacilli bacterium]